MEEIKKILIPTDGSEYTKLAVKKGLSLAKLLNAEVTALYVINEAAFTAIPPDSLITDIYSLLKTEGENVLQYVVDEGAEMGVKVEKMITEGETAESIIEVGEHFDLIVVGTLGRTGLSRLMIGSVAENVVRHATCPVMVVRAKDKI
ncbi:MAG: universal stress protein [Thermoplasmata archaeon]